MSYRLPDGYRENPVKFYEDTPEQANIYQLGVYAKALDICKTRVIDIGCACGYKLRQFHNAGYGVIGYDTRFHVSYCREHHPWGDWEYRDINSDLWSTSAHGQDVIVCADVVEHIKRPETMLSNPPRS